MSNYENDRCDRMSEIFKALANPQRLRLVLRLAKECAPEARRKMTPEEMNLCVGDLGADLGIAPSTVSHHIKELRRAGLMKVEKRGRHVGCCLHDDAVRELVDFFRHLTSECECQRPLRPGTEERTGSRK